MTLSPTVRTAISAAAHAHGVTKEEILSRKKKRKYVQARYMAMRMLHDQGWSLGRIGRALGVHHTTVLYAIRKEKHDGS